MTSLWELWRGASAGVAVALVLILVVRHVFEARIGSRLRRALDIVAGPLFVLFVLYIATDFYRGVP
ncbi:MAG: hypothetical protein E6K10_07210 [Methanobacteriota archaeon]|nr:MAG: hypothetical protein E6K10_07210 [Euryarchaeota archaeon]